MRKSIKGIPMNIIQGTNEIVRTNVRWYNGRADKCCPNRKWNSVMEG
ncbi:MAG: hypothetical protein ACTHJ5_14635 [Ilyomonas sp.]